MDIEEKISCVKRGAICEVLTEEELKTLFEANSHPKHYIGFEISGLVHLGTGLMTAMELKDFMKAGIKPTIFLADYHAYLNGKLGGDLEKIQKVAKGYFKKAFESLGLEEGKVEYVMGSDLYEKMGSEYWKDTMQIANDTTMKRMLRCTTIMGRSESDALPSSAVLYPAMQCADVWALDVDIMHAGLDQRKVHVLSRELAEKMKRKKAVAVHRRLVGSLSGPQRMDANTNNDDKMLADKMSDDYMIANKMSKSNPNSCIFIHDSEEEIKKKMKNAYCPAAVVEENPIIDYAELFVLRDKPLLVERPEKFGGDVEFENITELKTAFTGGKLHPMDLKNAVGRELISMLEPSRKYFEKHPELIEQVKGK